MNIFDFAMKLYDTTPDDPDDTIFLTLTAKEACLLYLAMSYLGTKREYREKLAETTIPLFRKFADTIEAQKSV